ncbi:MAG: oligosaccharide flippase family protein [Actinobacteria bacterium]|nr:oligosaccharide flippase family protein [Actinomycetota bacterium]
MAPLLLIPYALDRMGAELYGLWMAAASLAAVAAFADLGLGNGLMTRLTVAIAEGNVDEARREVSSAYAMTATVGTVVLGGIALAFFLTDPSNLLLNTNSPPPEGSTFVVLVCLLAFAVNIPLGLIQRIQYASQRVTMSNVWIAVASLASLAAFVGATEVGASPPIAIAASAFALPLANLVNSLVFFRFIKSGLRPTLRLVQTSTALSLLRLGGLFFFVSIATSIGLNIDPVLISRELGLSAAAEYAIAYKAVGILFLLITVVNLPLWPANGEALAKGDTKWVARSTIIMSLSSGIAILVAGAILIGPGQSLIADWLRSDSVAPSTLLLTALTSWATALGLAAPLFMIQNAAGVVWPQLLGWIAFLAVSIPLKLAAIRLWGVAGAPAAATLAYVACVVPFAFWGVVRSIRLARKNLSSRGAGDERSVQTAARPGSAQS